ETGVQSSSLTQSGRLYAEMSSTVKSGVALANPNNQDVSVSIYFTDNTGNNFGQGSFILPANGQIAGFLNQQPFNGPATMMGTFTFNSSNPISVAAFRGYINERGEFLNTAMPVTPLNTGGSTQLLYPHLVPGDWISRIVLINSTDTALSGTLQ